MNPRTRLAVLLFVLPPVWPASALAAADVALLVSDHTSAYFQSAYPAAVQCVSPSYVAPNEYQRYYRGWEHVLEHNGIPYTEIHDSDVTPKGLATYKVLILVNNFWLGDDQVKSITQWVRNGGHLLATYGSGYMGVNGEADFLKGGTNGLHELWGDPAGKVNSTAYLNPFPWVKVQITQNAGPSAGFAAGTVLDYAWNANLLTKRPPTTRDVNGMLNFCLPTRGDICLSSTGTSTSTGTLTRYPGILNNAHSKGHVVYYSFAPEYVISLAYDVVGHCANDPRYPGGRPYSFLSPTLNPALSGNLLKLMLGTLNFLKSPAAAPPARGPK